MWVLKGRSKEENQKKDSAWPAFGHEPAVGGTGGGTERLTTLGIVHDIIPCGSEFDRFKFYENLAKNAAV